ncbi:GNAT family N-acetyltransferase [Heyndrickxia acidicola]|uniref:GNAT family protein n=1 Tax=Heyndrickxia acidicola TaxID=209389 RepID=A0ABU6MM58_9BACI|nr:GNAT family protein [Heyndrickxia acidicola]MED1205766.1 GNAT family protein [Heyndrickxia acidicola]
MDKERLIERLPKLETERLMLRKIRTDDMEDMFEYCSMEDVAAYVNWHAHQSIEDTKVFLNHIVEQKTVFFGIEYKENHKLIGTINFVSWNQKHQKAEIAYILSKLYWRKGIITEAIKAIIQFGFTTMNLERIEARCIEDNLGSEGVMKKAGMFYEGTLRNSMFTKGKYRNLKLYSILKDEA